MKSDDVVGRAKAYEAIVKGEPMAEPGRSRILQRTAYMKCAGSDLTSH